MSEDEKEKMAEKISKVTEFSNMFIVPNANILAQKLCETALYVVEELKEQQGGNPMVWYAVTMTGAVTFLSSLVSSIVHDILTPGPFTKESLAAALERKRELSNQVLEVVRDRLEEWLKGLDISILFYESKPPESEE